MACKRSGLNWINVLAENRYLDGLSYGLQVSKLWCNSDDHSTISRNLISDSCEFDAPPACGFNVGLEIYKYQRGSNRFGLTQHLGFLGRATCCSRGFLKLGYQFLVSQIRRYPLRDTQRCNV